MQAGIDVRMIAVLLFRNIIYASMNTLHNTTFAAFDIVYKMLCFMALNKI